MQAATTTTATTIVPIVAIAAIAGRSLPQTKRIMTAMST